jgi:hypothetical protein
VAIFLLGLKELSREEKIYLLAQLNCLTTNNLLIDGLERGLSIVGQIPRKLAQIFCGPTSNPTLFQEDNEGAEAKVSYLAERIEEEAKALSIWHNKTIERELGKKMRHIAGVGPDASDNVLAAAIIHRLARVYKLDPSAYPNRTALETALFEACIQEQMQILQNHINKLSPRQEARFEEILNQQLKELSKADKEEIQRITNLNQLSARALIGFLKNTSTVALAQSLVAGTGFGAYLFLATAIKSVSLLAGVTFPFAVYATASSMLAFLLSGPFLLLTIFLSGGYIWRKTSEDLKTQLAKILFLTGRAKLAVIADSAPSPAAF